MGPLIRSFVIQPRYVDVMSSWKSAWANIILEYCRHCLLQLEIGCWIMQRMKYSYAVSAPAVLAEQAYAEVIL